MPRTLRRLCAITAFLAASIGAAPASAISSLDMVWSAPGTANHLSTSLTALHSSTVTALLVLRGDNVGITALSVSIVFDTNEFDFVSLKENAGSASYVSMGNQFVPLSATNTVVDEAGGLIHGFDSVTIGPGCINCTITLGSVRFHIASDGGFGTDAQAAFVLSTDEAVDPLAQQVPLSFSGVSNTVPEPGTALAVGFGLLGLGLRSRRATSRGESR